jgi:ABC-type molybdenum transport system ATPase subunit/photorepair protein PhrA
MPSDRKKAKAAASKAKAKSAGKTKEDTSDQDNGTTDVANGLGSLNLDSDRSCTGVLTSHPESRDVHIESFTMLFHGHQLLEDTRLELNFGRRYGLLGLNGCGKSSLLKALAAREVPIPEHVDLYLLDREIAASDITALQVRGGRSSSCSRRAWQVLWVQATARACLHSSSSSLSSPGQHGSPVHLHADISEQHSRHNAPCADI